MKLVKNVFGRLVNGLRWKGRRAVSMEAKDKKKAVVVLHGRINGLEKMQNAAQQSTKTSSPSDSYLELESLLQSEIRSRERLERKLTKTSKKMDHLATEFNVLQFQLKTSTIDLDLEKRKNAELRKRLNSHPIRSERRMVREH